MLMLFELGRKDMQSSPADITESEIWVLLELLTLIPSVLGLLPGADMLILLIITALQVKIFMWVFLLLRNVM